MERVAGTFFALLFLAWGLLTFVAGLAASRPAWVILGGGIAAFGCLFLPAVRYLWQAGPRDGRGSPEG